MHMSICTLCEKSSVRAAEKRFIQLSNRKNIVTTTRAENLATGNASDRSGLHSAPALFAGVVAKHLRLNAKMLSIVVMPAVRNPTARALRINHAIKKDTWWSRNEISKRFCLAANGHSVHLPQP